jgi:SPASM domain peptide maturase of grasp-with-spasm system
MEYLKIFERCQLVRGYQRSAIYDFDRLDYEFIPNLMYDILVENKRLLTADYYKRYSEGEQEIVKEYISFLVSGQYAFFCNQEETDRFPEISREWFMPSAISNAIVYLNENIVYLEKIINELCLLLCKDIVFIMTKLNYDYLELLSEKTDETSISSISLYILYETDIDINRITSFLERNKRIKNITFFSAPKSEKIYSNETQLQLLENITKDCSNCKRFANYPDSFRPDQNLFFESLKFNNCLTRKISIDRNGLIKNCPNMTENYGYISKISLSSILKEDRFMQYWKISKNKIDVCKDCEYRYMCMDCRYHINDKNNILSKPEYCRYNPYICKWANETDYVPVEECGTYSKETGFVPDATKIAELNKQIWGNDE